MRRSSFSGQIASLNHGGSVYKLRGCSRPRSCVHQPESSVHFQIRAGFQGMKYSVGISFLPLLFITAGSVLASLNCTSAAAGSPEEKRCAEPSGVGEGTWAPGGAEQLRRVGAARGPVLCSHDCNPQQPRGAARRCSAFWVTSPASCKAVAAAAPTQPGELSFLHCSQREEPASTASPQSRPSLPPASTGGPGTEPGASPPAAPPAWWGPGHSRAPG